jgi:hypothetical protein
LNFSQDHHHEPSTAAHDTKSSENPRCTLTLTVPEENDLRQVDLGQGDPGEVELYKVDVGKVHFRTNAKIEVTANRRTLSADELSFEAASGITLHPVKVRGLLRVHTEDGMLQAAKAEAGTYDVKNEKGFTTFQAAYPQSNSEMHQASGTFNLKTSGNSERGAELTFTGAPKSSQTSYRGFSGAFVAVRANGANRLRLPGQGTQETRGLQTALFGEDR